MKNCNVILALLFGYMVAGLSNYEGMPYVDSSKIESAPAIDFLWTHWFGLGLYGPGVIPLLIAYIVTTVETVGDITATHEVSELNIKSKEYTRRVQGGLMADSICSILASFCTSMPNTTFSQNNGVIALTKCASRRAGFATGFWLILMGVLSKIAGIITSIPDAVLGGMTIFLFSNVLVSGISLFGNLDLKSRRLRFITAMSLSVGVGVTVWPFAFQDMRASSYSAAFWTCADCSPTLKGFRNGVSIFLSTGYCIGSVIAIVLNAILPEDPEEPKVNQSVHWSMIGTESNAFDKSIKQSDSGMEEVKEEDFDDKNDERGESGESSEDGVAKDQDYA
jgi:uracil-xanthine permease